MKTNKTEVWTFKLDTLSRASVIANSQKWKLDRTKTVQRTIKEHATMSVQIAELKAQLESYTILQKLVFDTLEAQSLVNANEAKMQMVLNKLSNLKKPV